VPDDPYLPTPPQPPRSQRGQTRWTRGSYVSKQVNVDQFGINIVGDAANEPSIAVDPTDPNKIVIGWRQFDSIGSDFRQAGWGYSHDAGKTWTFPSVLEPGVFRSDPVLAANAEGEIYYYSLRGDFLCHMFKSTNGGVTWTGPIDAFGGDKAWMAIDRTGGIGHGNIYCAWDWVGCCGTNVFTRSADGGLTYTYPIAIPQFPIFGTIDVGLAGEVYVAGTPVENPWTSALAKSTTLDDPGSSPGFDFAVEVNLDGFQAGGAGPNPGGLLGQVWVATDHSNGPTRGNVYMLCSVVPYEGSDPLDLMFARSADGGLTWSTPVRVNDDPADNDAWQWFGTMSVAPNGRIDVIWNDTRNGASFQWSELFYSFSTDGGLTWSENVPVSPAFDSLVGWPQQNKLGDYYDAISDNTGVNIAYAATFNGEQDVYFLRILADCNGNGIADDEDIASEFSEDCTGNGVPDECDPDCNENELPDPCEILDGQTADCDGNWIPDECESDFDGDGAIDACDPDIDSDGIPNEEDVCAFTPPGVPVTADGRPIADMSGDCDVDLPDFALFPVCLALSGPEDDEAPALCLQWYDHDGDGDIDLADVRLFQTAFTGPGQ
jgi:hypothetical protein